MFVHGRVKSVLEATRFVEKKVYISEAEIAEENNRTMTFEEKGLFTCRHVYLCKQLLPQIKQLLSRSDAK